MKLNKKWILIAIIAVVIAAAAILAAFLLTPKTPDYTFPPFVDSYEKAKAIQVRIPISSLTVFWMMPFGTSSDGWM